MGLGAPELLILLVLILLLFGATRLPALGRSLGQAGKELRVGLREEEDGPRPVAGACPFCATEVPESSSFCPGCARSAADMVAEKVRQRRTA